MASSKASSPKAARDNTFSVVFENFHVGQGPLAHIDANLTELGQTGNYSTASNIDLLRNPRFLAQGPALATLTNGDETGAITDDVRFILDKPPQDGITYAISDSKLHQLTNLNVVTNSGAWPHTITGSTGGLYKASIAFLQGNLYYFFNKGSAGEIGKYDLSASFTDNWGSTVPTGAAALQGNVYYPVATKQDLMLFGNGRYLGVYNATTNTLTPQKLDFGVNANVVDVCFNANQWWIAVNYGTSNSANKNAASIFLYDASAISSILADEIGLGYQSIGLIYPVGGIIYVIYQDLSSGYTAIGYIKGRQIVPLRYAALATLPTYGQKTIFKNSILFGAYILSVFSAGAFTQQLPFQLSSLFSSLSSYGGVLAAPFTQPIVYVTDLSTHKKLQTIVANNSFATTSTNWSSITIPTVSGAQLGYIDRVIVVTKTLGAAARCDLTIDANQATKASAVQQITGTGKRYFKFSNLRFSVPIEDFAVHLDWTNGSASQNCVIRKIIVEGHYVEH